MPGRRELSFLRACRKVDISWDGLQFLCISVCWRLLKSMSYTFSEHAEGLISSENVFNFYALAYAGDCSKIWVILLRACRKVDISWDRLQFLCISLCRRLLKSMSCPFSGHAERLILAETVFSLCRRLVKSMSYPFSEHAERLILAKKVSNFYALAYAGDCSKVL